jgi:hypothetical protein
MLDRRSGPLSREGSLSVTRDLGFSGLIRKTAPFSRLLRDTRGCGGSILTRILTGINCYSKQGHYYSDHKVCETMTLNDILYNPATSTFLLEVDLALTKSHMHDMILRFESAGRYTHMYHKQVKAVYY